MTVVVVECPCGATLSIEDGTELTAATLLSQWHDVHGQHRRSLEEYIAQLHHYDRKEPEWPDAAGPGIP